MKTNNKEYSVTKIKKWEELTLADNFIFQKVMLNEELCTTVLSQILDLEITKIEYKDYEKTIDIRRDSKAIRLDVYVKNESTIYNIEIQQSSSTHIPMRSRYYQDLIDLDLLEKGMEYQDLNNSFVIFICTFDYFKLDQYKYTFKNKCLEVDGLDFGDGTTKIILNSNGTKGNISNELKEFLNCVNGIFASSTFSDKIKNEVEKVKCSEKWRREYMTLYLREQELKKAVTKEVTEKVTKDVTEKERESAIRNLLTVTTPDKIIEMGYDKDIVMNIYKLSK